MKYRGDETTRWNYASSRQRSNEPSLTVGVVRADIIDENGNTAVSCRFIWSSEKVPKYREYEAHSVAFAVRLDVVGRRFAEGRGFVASVTLVNARPSSSLDSSTGLPDAWRTIARPNVHFHSHWFRPCFPCPSIYPADTPRSPFHWISSRRIYLFVSLLLSVNRSNCTRLSPVCEIVPTYFKFNPFIRLQARTEPTGTRRLDKKLIECEKSFFFFFLFSFCPVPDYFVVTLTVDLRIVSFEVRSYFSNVRNELCLILQSSPL